MSKKQKQRQRRKRKKHGKSASRQAKQGRSPSRKLPADKLALLNSLDPWTRYRAHTAMIAEAAGEWAGIPAPIDGEQLVVDPTYRFAEIFNKKREPDPDVDKIRNVFYSKRLRCDIIIWQEDDGTIRGALDPKMNHVGQLLRTVGCSVAWGIEQEARALELLAGMLRHHQFKQYLLTGMFLESSKRSGLMYLFRRLRPTVAITMRGDEAKILCALCLHPIAYYADSWAGAMCPTDDVIAHLALMRGDEHEFWKQSNQHGPLRPEAGI